MPALGIRVAQPFVQLRQLQMRGIRRLDRKARFEIALRLAPQPLLRAQFAEHEQEHRITRVGLEPVFGTLNLADHLGPGAFSVKRDQIGIPCHSQRLLDDLVCLRAAAECREALRCGCRNFGVALFARGDFPPAFLKRAEVECLALQIVGVGITPELPGLGRIEYAAPLELVDERQRLLPVPGLLLRFQFEPQRRGMLFRQRFQCEQRILKAALVKQHRGCGDDAHRGISGSKFFGAREVAVALLVMAQLMRRARCEHGAEHRRFARLHCARRGFLGAAVALLEKRFQRFQQHAARVFPAPPLAEVAYLRRQPERTEDKPQQQIKHRETDGHQQQHQIERQLDPIRRPYQQRVAGVEAQRQRQRDSKRK